MQAPIFIADISGRSNVIVERPEAWQSGIRLAHPHWTREICTRMFRTGQLTRSVQAAKVLETLSASLSQYGEKFNVDLELHAIRPKRSCTISYGPPSVCSLTQVVRPRNSHTLPILMWVPDDRWHSSESFCQHELAVRLKSMPHAETSSCLKKASIGYFEAARSKLAYQSNRQKCSSKLAVGTFTISLPFAYSLPKRQRPTGCEGKLTCCSLLSVARVAEQT